MKFFQKWTAIRKEQKQEAKKEKKIKTVDIIP